MYNINWTPEKQNEVLSLIDKFVKKYPYAESIYQSVEGQIDGLELLSVISDVLQATPVSNGKVQPCPWDNTHGDHSIF
jgi:hypothetical protein